ncbi:MAG TPA: hypothetical protein VKB26_03205 [Candidatus Acidoferrales bacterium]|nr:hypothetical protein [Candidatus Acidoferrales bacterium]
MSSDKGRPRHTLNESQERHIRVVCQYVDRLFSEIESILASATSKSAFPKYIPEVSAEDRKAIEDSIDQIRAQFVRALDGQSIARERAAIPDARAICATLDSIEISLDELRPKNMRGYGEVPESAAKELERIAEELQEKVARLNRFVMTRGGEQKDSNESRKEST